MTRMFIALCALLLAPLAHADQSTLAGTWRGSDAAVFSVAEDGRFDWQTGAKVTGGTWQATTRLISLVTEVGEVTYAFAVEGDVLRLVAADGTEIIMKKAALQKATPKR